MTARWSPVGRLRCANWKAFFLSSISVVRPHFGNVEVRRRMSRITVRMGLRWIQEYCVAIIPLKAFRKWEIDFPLLRWASLSNFFFQCDFEFFFMFYVYASKCGTVKPNKGEKHKQKRGRARREFEAHDMKLNERMALYGLLIPLAHTVVNPLAEGKQKLGLCYVCLPMKHDDARVGKSPKQFLSQYNRIMCKFSDLVLLIFSKQSGPKEVEKWEAFHSG